MKFQLVSRDCETPKGPSMTIEDDALNIKDILVKYTNGLDAGLFRAAVDADTEDFDSPDLSSIGRLDISEASEMLDSVRKRNNDAIAAGEKSYESLKQKRLNEAFEKEAEKAAKNRPRKAKLPDEGTESGKATAISDDD